MKSIYLHLALVLSLSACKTQVTTELQPLGENATKKAAPLIIDEEHPYLQIDNQSVTEIRVPENAEENTYQIQADYHYISLETKDECLIGKIDKLFEDDNSIYVLDKENSQALRFSREGKFLARFGKKGRGPGEFSYISDFTVDKKRQEVCVLDNQGAKILFYDKNGTFLREQPFYYYFSQFEFLGDKMVLHTGFNGNIMAPSVNNNRIVVSERNQNPLYLGFPYPATLTDNFHHGMLRPLTTFNNEVYYNHVLSDTIWQIKEESCQAKYVFKFKGRDNLFDAKNFQNITDDEYKSKCKNVQSFSGSYLVTKGFIMARISQGNNQVDNLLYCKSTGHIIFGTLNFFNLYRANFLFDYTLNDTSFVEVLQPFQIIRNIKEYPPRESQLTEEDKKLLSTMKEEDNPVLMVINLKEF